MGSDFDSVIFLGQEYNVAFCAFGFDYFRIFF